MPRRLNQGASPVWGDVGARPAHTVYGTMGTASWGIASGRASLRPWGGCGRLRLGLACLGAAGLVALAGCGASKPGYCSDRTNLENSVKGLSSLSFSSGLSAVQAQLKKIETDANALVSSAKSDFPNQTSAIKSSVDAFASALKALPSNPSAGQVATVASDGARVVSSVNSFVDASSSKCS